MSAPVTVRLTVEHPSGVSVRALLENPALCEVNVAAADLRRIVMTATALTEVRAVRVTQIDAQLVTPAWDRRFSRAPLVVTLSAPPWTPCAFAHSATPPSAQMRCWCDTGAHWHARGIQARVVPVQGALLANEHACTVFRAPPPTEAELQWATAMTSAAPSVPPEASAQTFWSEAMHRHWPRLNRHAHHRLSAATPPNADAMAQLVQACVDEHMPAASFYLNLDAPLRVQFVWPDAEWEGMRLAANALTSGPTAVVTLTLSLVVAA